MRPRYALFPLEGYPPSKLPAWPNCEARILASPALGAEFAQYHINMPAGAAADLTADAGVETFLYVHDGSCRLMRHDIDIHLLTAGGFALLPPNEPAYRLEADAAATLLMLKKVYEPVDAISAPSLTLGSQASVPAAIYNGDEGCRLQTLLPDTPAFDMAMNIFEFQPGRSLPVVETHVMEHGLFFLQGKGVYYLDDEWMEVEAEDFIWMGPYVPQSFYATGPIPSKYIYYKNVNRDVPL